MIRLIAMFIALTFTASAEAKTLELSPDRTVYISGPIGGNSLDIANKIEELAQRPNEDIHLVINSPGGEVVLGYIIINSMNVAKDRGVKFICYVPQLAASMAFQVFANCDERYTLPGAYLLWHPVRVSAQIPLTPALTKQMYIELRHIERRMTAELLSVLKVTNKFFYYHYLAETLWTAKLLNKEMPDFFTVVNDANGLPTSYQQFELRQTNPFGAVGRRGYKFIYQSPHPINAIRQP